jgi:hypothetical protein
MANLSSVITQTVGASAGGVNVIASPNTSASWGTTSLLTLSTTSTVAELPLQGAANSAVKFALVGSATSAYLDFFIPTALLNTKLILSWYARASATTIGAATLSLSSFATSTDRSAGTNATVITMPTSSVATAAQQFATSFDANSQQFYRLTISFPSAASQWYSVAQVVAGVGTLEQGAAVSDWISYTPTLTGSITNPTKGTNTEKAYWRRVGSTMEIQYSYEQSAAGSSGNGFYALSLPLGYTVDSTVLQATTSGAAVNMVGSAYIYNGTTEYIGDVIVNTTSYSAPANAMNITIFTSIGATTGWGNGNAAFGGTTLRVKFFARIPIAEWSGNGTVNLGAGAQVEYAATSGPWDANSSTTVYGPAGQLMGGALLTVARTKTITWQYPAQSTDQVRIEVSYDGLNFFDPGTIFPRVYDSTGNDSASAGVFILSSTSTTVTVQFNRYQAIANDDAPSFNWPSNMYWRVCKAKASSPVGFGLAGTDGSSGLYKAGSAPGLTTGATISTGSVGQVIESVSGLIGLTGNGQYTDITSVTLTPGIWLMNAACYSGLNTATAMTVFYGAIGTVAGNNSTGIIQGNNQFDVPPPTTGYNTSVAIPGIYVNISSNTTYYLKGLASYSGGTPQAKGRLTAVRIA